MTQPMPRRRWKGLRPPINAAARRYHVYHLYDAEGVLLYVGRSCEPMRRLRAHLQQTEWAARVVEAEGHGPYTWDEAVRRERRDILRLRPLHNIDGIVKNTGSGVEVA